MKTHNYLISAAALLSAICSSASAQASNANSKAILETSAYSWVGDTLYQGPFKAWAEGENKIVSNYHGRPGYFMPVEQVWVRKNDLSAYPHLKGGELLHQAIYNMGLDEMVNAVEPDTTLRTGKEWAGVWTRDVSYSIILSMAALQPEASMISLMKKVNPSGQIIQDTGSGGAWPISTDRMIWVLAAWEIYKVTGDTNWLKQVYPIACRSIAKDDATIRSETGLVKGETSFIDWREQSYPKWMQTTDISQSEAMNTNVLYAAALQAVSDMANTLGKKKEAAEYAEASQILASKIDETFYMPAKGYYGMYTYGRDNKILNPRAETLGEALAILYDIAPAERQKEISEHNPTTPFGPAIFYPQIADMPSYHNNALWPFVAGYWTLAQAKAGNEQGTLEGIGSIFRPAALFATNKENFNLDNGDYFTELNSSNMLWSLSANLAVTQQILFGIHFEADGLRISPFVPQALAADRTLENFPYRNAKLNISVSGFGNKVKSLTLNGKSLDPTKTIPAKLLAKGGNINVVMNNQPIAPMQVNHQPNLKAPLTPQTWIERTPQGDMLTWNPIEYIAGYKIIRNGKEIAQTRQTSYLLTEPGEWQVVGVSGDGVESFASEPRSNRTLYTVEFPAEKRIANSGEISYPADVIEGMNGGFVETDTKSKPINFSITIPEDGEYSMQVRYANGNGPVNTENKAAIRTLKVDGQKAGTLVMPTRGVANWNDWGLSNGIKMPLTKGTHNFEILYLPEDENMNIATNHALLDRIVLTLQ